MAGKNYRPVLWAIQGILGAVLSSSCVMTNSSDQVLDGYLIKKSKTTSYVMDQSMWLSEVKSKDPAMAPVLESVSRQDWKESIVLARQVLKNRPFYKPGFLVLATAYAELNQWDQAAFYARYILRNDPDHVASLNIMGLYTLSGAKIQEDYREALRYFRRAFQQNSSEVAAGLNLGYLCLDLGHHGNAGSVFSESYRRCGSCAEAGLGLAIAMSRSGQTSRARTLLKQVVKKNPDSMTAWYQLALLVRNIDKDYEQSSEHLKHILEHPEVKDSELLEKARVLWYANRSVKGL